VFYDDNLTESNIFLFNYVAEYRPVVGEQDEKNSIYETLHQRFFCNDKTWQDSHSYKHADAPPSSTAK
jgi:hypothetical protein